MKFYRNIVMCIFISSISCKNGDVNTVPNIEFEDSFYSPYDIKLDNNDLECNYYFTEDANDILEIFSRVINKEIYSIETLQDFMDQQMDIQYSTDEEKIQKINIISNQISNITGYEDVQYFVVNMPGYYNAWMLLGDIYITEALMGILENDHEIAFILSHELAHVINHMPHQKNLISSLYSAYNSGDFSDQINIAINKILDWSGKGDENEADVAALVIMSRSGYNANKGIEVFKKTLESNDPPGSFVSRLRDEFNRSHPYSKDRYECLNEKIKKYGLSKENYQQELIDQAEVIYNEALIYEFPSEFSQKK